METENKEQSSASSKSWWEKLAESFAGNIELIKNLVALFSNPLIVSSLTVAFLCWIFHSKENSQGLGSQNEQLRDKLDKTKRKCKKLKKKLRKAVKGNSQNDSQKPHPLAGNREGSFDAYFFN